MKKILLALSLAMSVLGLTSCGKGSGDPGPSPTDTLNYRLLQMDNNRFTWNKDSSCHASVRTNRDQGIATVSVSRELCPSGIYGMDLTFVCQTNMICKAANPNVNPVYGLILVNENTFSLSSTSNGITTEWVFYRN